MDATIAIKMVAELSDAEQHEAYQLLKSVFGGEVSVWTWAEDDWRLLARVNGKMVTHIGIVVRTCLVKNQTVKVGGIGGVATLEEWRGQGLATQAMRAAADFLKKQLKVDFGMLFCSREMVPFYQRLGWRLIDAPVFFDQPGGKMQSDCPVMYLPCTKPYFPWGDVNICGYPW